MRQSTVSRFGASGEPFIFISNHHFGGSPMKVAYVLVFLSLWTTAPATPAQETIAQGEYEVTGKSFSVVPTTKIVTRWTLASKSSGGGYRLQSEIQAQPANIRIVQSEELDSRYVPVAIGYELYRGQEKVPSLTANCDLSRPIVCTGVSGADRAVESEPYKPAGPFWLWMEGVPSDLAWLLGGTINMANLKTGKTDVATLSVFGGTAVMIGDAVAVATLESLKRPITAIVPDKPIGWKLSIKEELLLQLVGTETMQFNNTKIVVTHYTLGSSSNATHLWTAGAAGIVVKMGDWTLANYKQYRPIIPELVTGSQPHEDPAPKVQ
jgi:hypothetical protein